ncbi:MAG: hypothetical protein V7644_1059, partial [Actinomycetota bacterium]
MREMSWGTDTRLYLSTADLRVGLAAGSGFSAGALTSRR